ncbi:rRNA-processing protein las1 [Coemansia sp. RSA 2618]|nr:rRNA-processing protein las1 [Coemansia sp. RSA 2618]
MSRVPRLVPWASTEEYMRVAGQLYAEDTATRMQGVAAVKAWRSRARVAAAIDATANLVEVMAAGGAVSAQRHMHAMALVRFVNAIVDLEQRGAYAQSMAALASRIGMPAWFVELRHACTHEQVPGLAVLRAACAQAHSWLGDYYWQRQARTLPADTMDRVRSAVAAYSEKKSVVVQTQDAQSQSGFEAAKSTLTSLLGVLHADALRLYVVPVLLEPGFLVPTDRRQRARFPECVLPAGLARQWASLFHLLGDAWSETQLYSELLAGIGGVLAPEPGDAGVFAAGDDGVGTSHAATLVAWVRWVAEKHSAIASAGINDLVEACLRSPGYYARATLKAVSDTDAALRRELKPFVDYMGKALAALAAADAAPIRVDTSETALHAEEELMQQRLDAAFGASQEMSVDAAEPEAPLQACRWAYAAAASGPIGTQGDGVIPPLELPGWLDEVALQVT